MLLKDNDSKEFFIVDKRVLPNSIQNVIKVNELVKQEKLSKHEAIKRIGISRSTYYKYKDYIKPFFEGRGATVFNVNLVIDDQPGMLSKIFNIIANSEINILTITQNIPLDGIARVTLALTTDNGAKNIETMIERITNLEGLKEIRIVGNN